MFCALGRTRERSFTEPQTEKATPKGALSKGQLFHLTPELTVGNRSHGSGGGGESGSGLQQLGDPFKQLNEAVKSDVKRKCKARL